MEISSERGEYNMKFHLSDGREIDAGNFTADGAPHTYLVGMKLSNGEVKTFSFQTGIGDIAPDALKT